MLLRTAKIFAAIILFIIGIAGLFLPILPGFPFILLGLFLIKPTYKDRFKNWFEKKKIKFSSKKKPTLPQED